MKGYNTVKNENLIKLLNYGSLLYQTKSDDLDRVIENIDDDSTYTLREILQMIRDVCTDEQ